MTVGKPEPGGRVVLVLAESLDALMLHRKEPGWSHPTITRSKNRGDSLDVQFIDWDLFLEFVFEQNLRQRQSAAERLTTETGLERGSERRKVYAS